VVSVAVILHHSELRIRIFGRFGSDSLVFATSLMTFTRYQADLQGLPEPTAPFRSGRSNGSATYTFASPSECPPPRLISSRRSPLMGFASPRRRSLLTRVHSHQLRRASFGHRSPHRRSRSAHVVSHHLDGFLREQVVSLLHLTTGQRFAPFPLLRPPDRCLSIHPGYLRRFPAARPHPSKNSPRLQPHRVTTAVALLTLPLAPPGHRTAPRSIARQLTCDSIALRRWAPKNLPPKRDPLLLRRFAAGQILVPVPFGNRFPRTAVLSLPEGSLPAAQTSRPCPKTGSSVRRAWYREAVSRRSWCASCRSTLPHHRSLPGRPPKPSPLELRVLPGFWSGHQSVPPLRCPLTRAGCDARSWTFDLRRPTLESSPSGQGPLDSTRFPRAHRSVRREAPVVDTQSLPRSWRLRRLLSGGRGHLLPTGPAFQGPSPCRDLRCQRPHSAIPQKSSRLQGFAPLTSP
jgi:hypothetical protein